MQFVSESISKLAEHTKQERKKMSLLTIISMLLLGIVTFIHCLNIIHNKLRKLPPGPTSFPIIGNLHLLGAQPHQSFARLAKTYGPVMSFQLGQVTTIVISSVEMAKQVLQKQDLAFSSRHILDATHAHEHFKHSVLFLPVDTTWRFLRKMMSANIFSSSRLDSNQDLRSQKVQELVAYCQNRSLRGKGIDIGQVAFTTSMNMVSNTIFSRDLADIFSDSATEFKSAIRGIMMESGKPNLADLYPILKKVDPQGIRRRVANHADKIFEIIGSLVTERLEQRKNHGIANNDVLDVLLTTSQENPEEINRTRIEHFCFALFLAGSDTTSSTVEWAMAEVLRNPTITKKVKTELEEVIGKGKMISEADVTNLPYLQCIVKETLRLHPPAPFLLPRRVIQDVDLCGYKVPKNSQVLVNVWVIGRDPALWEDPLEFKPERFLNSGIDFRGTDFELIPFGAGRRVCPGLPLAARLMPVLLGTLLNSFDWKIEGGLLPKQLDMVEMFGFTMQKASPLRVVPISL